MLRGPGGARAACELDMAPPRMVAAHFAGAALVCHRGSRVWRSAVATRPRGAGGTDDGDEAIAALGAAAVATDKDGCAIDRVSDRWHEGCRPRWSCWVWPERADRDRRHHPSQRPRDQALLSRRDE